jgi:hypothetical protein
MENQIVAWWLGMRAGDCFGTTGLSASAGPMPPPLLCRFRRRITINFLRRTLRDELVGKIARHALARA